MRRPLQTRTSEIGRTEPVELETIFLPHLDEIRHNNENTGRVDVTFDFDPPFNLDLPNPRQAYPILATILR